MRPQRQRLQRFVERIAQTERRVGQAELAGLDLREVEDVVDDSQERVGRALDQTEILALAR